jgi:hypothetical protein
MLNKVADEVQLDRRYLPPLCLFTVQRHFQISPRETVPWRITMELIPQTGAVPVKRISSGGQVRLYVDPQALSLGHGQAISSLSVFGQLDSPQPEWGAIRADAADMFRPIGPQLNAVLSRMEQLERITRSTGPNSEESTSQSFVYRFQELPDYYRFVLQLYLGACRMMGLRFDASDFVRTLDQWWLDQPPLPDIDQGVGEIADLRVVDYMNVVAIGIVSLEVSAGR